MILFRSVIEPGLTIVARPLSRTKFLSARAVSAESVVVLPYPELGPSLLRKFAIPLIWQDVACNLSCARRWCLHENKLEKWFEEAPYHDTGRRGWACHVLN
jgi:hypothetical protein